MLTIVLNFFFCFQNMCSVGSTNIFLLLLCIVAEDYHERKPCAYHWKSGKALPVSTYRKRLDRVTFDGVCWMPYGDLHVVRDFELISLFSRHI